MTKSNARPARERRSSPALSKVYDLLAPKIEACVNAHDVSTASIEFGQDGIPMDYGTVRRVITRYHKKLEKEGIPYGTTKNSLVCQRALFKDDKGYFDGFFRSVLDHMQRQKDSYELLKNQLDERDEIIERQEEEIARLKANPRAEVEQTLWGEMQGILKEIDGK